jgi:tripartite-type tricarboxylate transporter receptor subunit TctC
MGKKPQMSANKMVRRLFFGVWLVFPFATVAQTYPTKPIRLIVPFTAGGGTDISARIVGQKLSERLGAGAGVVVDNRTGAGGIVGTEIVARAAPDGYTLVLVSSSHAINPSLHKKLPYDSVKDFAPVSLVVMSPGMLVVNNSVPARNVKEFVEWVRSKPGQLTYGSAGTATPVHLSMELLKSMERMDIVHAPYKGAGAAIPDLLGGHIVAMIPSTASVLSLVKAGKLRALAVTSRARTISAPDVPTMIEAGIPGYEASSWYGLLAPANTPRAIVTRLSAEIAQIVKMADVRERLVPQGLDPVGSTPAEFAATINAELAKWAGVIKAAGLKPE